MIDRFKCQIFIYQELEEDHQYNRQQLRDNLIHLKCVDASVKDCITQHQSAQTYTKEYGESTRGFIFHLEIVIAVQSKAGRDSCQHTDTIGHQIMNPKNLD
jgi:hypothetical protein